MSAIGSGPPYWSQDASALAAALGSGPGGLSADRAAAQLALVGPNSVEDAPRLSALRLLLRQFASPLVLVLAFAAAISLGLQQWVDAAIILMIVVGSSLLSFFQEYRASTAVEELRLRLALMCRVVRGRLCLSDDDGTDLTAPGLLARSAYAANLHRPHRLRRTAEPPHRPTGDRGRSGAARRAHTACRGTDPRRGGAAVERRASGVPRGHCRGDAAGAVSRGWHGCRQRRAGHQNRPCRHNTL
jgi:hypothetical protein